MLAVPGRWRPLLLAATLLAAIASSAGTVPSREELQEKSSKELKAILKSRGAKCRKCLEKEDLIDRVVVTWEWSAVEAVSPDGKVKMTRDQFTKTFQSSFKKHLSDQRTTRIQADDDSGHQLATEDEEEEDEDGRHVPDVDKVWADFSERLRMGEISADDKGNLVYEYAGLPREPTWWDRYKTHVLLAVNVLILWFMQHVRRREKDLRKEEREKQVTNTSINDQVTTKEKGGKKKGKGGKSS
mmetsp:Transcript_64001/g.208836  ORF Transcript_64001/g.208836 Transcript_64001/m.208836 type:complete len:242 (-) Transcript_64001:120-845(-)